MGGARLMETLREEATGPRIVVYGEQTREAHLGAIGAGAAGFVPRSGAVETLLETCTAVARGKMVFPYIDVRDLQNNLLQSLSRRETDMLEALSRGLTNRELSVDLGISANTVKFHLSNLYAREGFRRESLTAPVCAGVIMGLGVQSYRLALHAVAALLA